MNTVAALDIDSDMANLLVLLLDELYRERGEKPAGHLEAFGRLARFLISEFPETGIADVVEEFGP